MKIITLLLLIVMVFSLVLVSIWFKDGYILGTAEAQITFYNLTRFYEQVKFAWSDTNPGLGFANGIVTAYAPTFLVLSLLEKFNIPGFITEAGLFWLFLVTAGIGIIILTHELFPKISLRYTLVAVLFYWFNLMSLVNIWNRFLYNYIALWALLPIACAFYIKGLNKQNLSYIFIVGIICGIFSLGLSNPVFNIILWFVFVYITLFKILTTKKSILFYTKFFFFSLVYFCLVNLWWIGQVVRYFFEGRYSQELSSFYQDTVSLSTFNSLSKSLGDLTNLFRLLHKSFFTTPFVEWAKLFVSPLAASIEFLATGVIFFYIYRHKKNINILLLGSLFIVSLFLAKGSNPPFGGVFQFLFTQSTFLQFFRNPFEKFGFIIPLAATPLLAAGLEDLSLRFQKKTRFIIYIISLGIIIGLYGYPFWSGLVFTNMFPPTNDYSVGYKVKVPDYYEQANNWLQSQGSNFRFIGFPFNGQGVTYAWEKGYQGIETSMWLFSTPHIMFSTTILYFDQIADQLEELFMKQKDFYKIMNILNIRYLMVRSDVDFQERYMREPKRLTEVLNKMGQEDRLKQVATFDKLSFWENPYWKDNTIYAAGNLMRVSPNVKLGDFILPEASAAAAASQQTIPDVDRLVGLEIIHPQDIKDKSKSKLNVYKFEIKEKGSYKLVVNSQVVRVDQNKIESKPSQRADGKYAYGSLDLDKGFHEFEVVTQISDNLASQIKERNSYTILDFDPYSKYLISFEYSSQNSRSVKMMISHDNDPIKNGRTIPAYNRDLSVNSGYNFSSFQDIFEPKNTASDTRIYFSDDQDDLIIKNMTAKKIINPEIMLIRKIENNSQPIPNLTYTKVSPTQYKVHIKNSENPFVLIFSSTYNPGWELIYSDGSKAKNHFLVNSFANGWVINRLGEYDLILNYSLQDDLNRDSAISIFSSILGLVILSIGLVFKMKRRSSG